jgi:hypothetical protein
MGQATSAQIHRLFFGHDPSTALRRLRKLSSMRLIDVHAPHLDEPNIYTLGSTGLSFLVENGFSPVRCDLEDVRRGFEARQNLGEVHLGVFGEPLPDCRLEERVHGVRSLPEERFRRVPLGHSREGVEEDDRGVSGRGVLRFEHVPEALEPPTRRFHEQVSEDCPIRASCLPEHARDTRRSVEVQNDGIARRPSHRLYDVLDLAFDRSRSNAMTRSFLLHRERSPRLWVGVNRSDRRHFRAQVELGEGGDVFFGTTVGAAV